MKDGFHHDLAADNQTLLRDWLKDLQQLHKKLMRKSPLSNDHNGFEIIEEGNNSRLPQIFVQLQIAICKLAKTFLVIARGQVGIAQLFFFSDCC